ncbi:hypothetical protein A5687_14710 [Mycobacterium mantenii]|uniref:hypothetical protein n=1 Tax=Mycobacterium mantenii TaxID=560555 RepID=UPI00080043EF|nr:hypothetical protein [Mycobacterium mantenii]OBH48872.1 hypothetical protein A5687_14710 [Mycobacterium mantenii]
MATDDRLGDQELPAEQITWAGLPVNLDFAFSQAQRDKVYSQHLMRKRWCTLRNGAAARDGDLAAESVPLDADAGRRVIG